MTSLALMEVQRALYTQLSGDGVLMGMISGIHDVVPQQSPVPYVVVGDGKQTVEPANAVNVTECELDLCVWTDAVGRKTALAIMNRLYALLHLGTLTLSGFQLVTLRVEQAATTLLEQGTYLRGILTIRVAVAEV